MTPKAKVIQALKCADADLLGTLQRHDSPAWSQLDKHDRSAIEQTREEIVEALKLVKRYFRNPVKKR